MISLLHILTEVNEEKFNLSALNNLDDEIEKALETLPKNEALITTALAASVIIKAIYKIITSIAQNNGIDLNANKPRAIALIQQTAEKIDSFVDTSLGRILSGLIKDKVKREKLIKIIKAFVIAGMAIAAGIGAASGISDIIKQFAPDLAQKLIAAVVKNDSGVLTNILKISLEGLGVAI